MFTGVYAPCVLLPVRCPGPLAPVHRCIRSTCCAVCAVSRATWLLVTCVPDRCVVLCMRCPGPLGSFSLGCLLSALSCLYGVLGDSAPVRRCARSVRCVACAVSWAAWLLFTGAPGRGAVLCVRRPGPLGPYSPVCPLYALRCVCGVLGHVAPVHRCARSVRCVCGCSVLCHLAPAHRFVRSVRCVACAASWASWLLFTFLHAWCFVWHVRCPGPLGSCSPVCSRGVLCYVCGVLGHLAPVQRCAPSAFCVTCAVSGSVGSCSPVCTFGVLCCVCGVLGHLAPLHRCARRRVVLRVRCPGPLGSCSPVCALGVLCCVCWALAVLAPCRLPPLWCACCSSCYLIAPRCAVLSSGVLRCRVAVFCAACSAVVPGLALLWAAARCAVFYGPASCVLCCAVGCCCVLRGVSGCVVALHCL